MSLQEKGRESMQGEKAGHARHEKQIMQEKGRESMQEKGRESMQEKGREGRACKA
jgi:hypothetical protein